MLTTRIKEIFTSIQGEGHYIGYPQLFIRFSECDFNCKYCETDYKPDATSELYTANSLAERLKSFDTKNIHSLCLTGGEPLIETPFLKEFLRNITFPVFLETNATRTEELEEIINMIKYVSANIKLPSASGEKDCFDKHDKFITTCAQAGKDVYMKVLFDENITDYEIEKCLEIAKKNNVELILQPVTKDGKINIKRRHLPEILEKFRRNYKNVRLIPQVHKSLCVR